MGFRCWFFGSGQVEVGGGKIIPLRARKQLALLAYLMMEQAHPHSRDTLLALLWPDFKLDAARNNLRVTLANLHKRATAPTGMTSHENKSGAMATPLILSNQYDVQLNPDAEYWVDAIQFQKLLSQTRTHAHTSRAECDHCQPLLAEAVALYQDEFLVGYSADGCPTFEEWLLVQRERHHLLAMNAYADLATFSETYGDLNRALVYASAQTTLDGLNEAAYRQQMRILVRQGERGKALTTFEKCSQTLQEQLGIEPAPETLALRRQILDVKSGNGLGSSWEEADPAAENMGQNRPVSTPPSRPLPSRTAPLPTALTSLIGRADEVKAVMAMLQNPTVSLLTLTGLGGVGKTMLAGEVARQLENRYRDGVQFISLAAIEADKTQLISAIAYPFNRQLGLGKELEEPLLAHLSSLEMLLVLDNFEHLSAESELLRSIKERAPGVTVLLTSRDRLNLSHEVIYRLGGLEIPPCEWGVGWGVSAEAQQALAQPADKGDRLPAYSAVELFVSAAKRLQPDFTLNLDNGAAVAKICRLVGGIPLGLELAAAWTHMLDCSEIAVELERNLELLSSNASDWPERQRTVRGVLEYAWATLSADEQLALMQLTCFRGTFDHPAALEVAQTPLPTLSALVDKSLVQRAGRGSAGSSNAESARFTLHSLVRQFAVSRMEQVCTDIQDRVDSQATFYLDGFHPAGIQPADVAALMTLAATHSRYYVGKLGEIGERIDSSANKALLPKLRLDSENIQHAYRHAVQQGPLEELRECVRAVTPTYRVNGWNLENSQLIQIAIDRLREFLEGATMGVDTLDISTLGPSARSISAIPGMTEMPESSSERLLWETLSWLMIQKAVAFNRLGKYRAVVDLTQSAIAIAQRFDLPALLIESYIAWGGALSYMSDTAAHEPLDKALAIARDKNLRQYESITVGMLGTCHLREFRLEDAYDCYEQSVQIARRCEDWRTECLQLVSSGWALERLGEFGKAKRRHERGLTICEKMAYPTGAARALQGLGLVATAQWNLHQATQHHRDAIAIAQQLNDRQREAVNRYHLGRTLMLAGDSAQAKEHLQTTIELAREVDDFSTESLTLSCLGYIETLWGCEVMAEEYLEHALEIGTALEDIEALVAANQGIGWLKLQQGKPVAAESYFEEELRLKQRWARPYAIIDPQTGLAQAALVQGLSERAEKLCEPIFTFLEDETPHGSMRLAHSLSVCYQVRMNQPASDLKPDAEALSLNARSYLQTVAAQFPTEKQRSFFLQNIPIHQTMLTADV